MGTSYSPNIVKDGLVFYVDPINPRSWVGPTSDTVNNLSNNTTATIFNDTSGSYGSNKSFAFDSVDDYINCGTVFTNTTSKTLACWFNPTNFIPGNTRHMISKWDATTSNRVIQLNMNNSTPYFFVSSNGTSFGSIPLGTTITANNWYYLVGVFDDDNNKIKISLNGGDFISTNYTAGMLSNSTTNLNIGGQKDDGTFNGEISAIQIYNKALSAQEVKQNYNALKSRFT